MWYVELLIPVRVSKWQSDSIKKNLFDYETGDKNKCKVKTHPYLQVVLDIDLSFAWSQLLSENNYRKIGAIIKYLQFKVIGYLYLEICIRIVCILMNK